MCVVYTLGLTAFRLCLLLTFCTFCHCGQCIPADQTAMLQGCPALGWESSGCISQYWLNLQTQEATIMKQRLWSFCLNLLDLNTAEDGIIVCTWFSQTPHCSMQGDTEVPHSLWQDRQTWKKVKSIDILYKDGRVEALTPSQATVCRYLEAIMLRLCDVSKKS